MKLCMLLFFFQRSFRWRPELTRKVRRQFDAALQIELKLMMSQCTRAHKEGRRWPSWTTQRLRQQLLARWANPAHQAKVVKNRTNRMAEKVPGEGMHTHNAGSMAFSKKKKHMV